MLIHSPLLSNGYYIVLYISSICFLTFLLNTVYNTDIPVHASFSQSFSCNWQSTAHWPPWRERCVYVLAGRGCVLAKCRYHSKPLTSSGVSHRQNCLSDESCIMYECSLLRKVAGLMEMAVKMNTWRPGLWITLKWFADFPTSCFAS